jgi:ribosomal protein S17E
MSDQERYEIAKAYVDKQLKTMEENGLKVKKVSEHEYKTIVKRVAQNVTSSGHSKSTETS